MSLWDNVKKFAQPYADDDYDDYGEDDDYLDDGSWNLCDAVCSSSGFA